MDSSEKQSNLSESLLDGNGNTKMDSQFITLKIPYVKVILMWTGFILTVVGYVLVRGQQTFMNSKFMGVGNPNIQDVLTGTPIRYNLFIELPDE